MLTTLGSEQLDALLATAGSEADLRAGILAALGGETPAPEAVSDEDAEADPPEPEPARAMDVAPVNVEFTKPALKYTLPSFSLWLIGRGFPHATLTPKQLDKLLAVYLAANLD